MVGAHAIVVEVVFEGLHDVLNNLLIPAIVVQCAVVVHHGRAAEVGLASECVVVEVEHGVRLSQHVDRRVREERQ